MLCSAALCSAVRCCVVLCSAVLCSAVLQPQVKTAQGTAEPNENAVGKGKSNRVDESKCGFIASCAHTAHCKAACVLWVLLGSLI